MKLTNKGMSIVFKGLAFLVYLIPMAVLFGVNYAAYRKTEGLIGFWGVVLLAFVVLALKNILLTAFKKQPLIFMSLTVFIISLLMGKISDQMFLISGVSTVAAVFSGFVSTIADSYTEHAYKVIDGEKTLNTAPAISVRQARMEAYGFIFTKE